MDRRDVDEYTVEMTFQVDEEFKGDLGDTVVIRTPGTGAQCGLGGGVGSRMALFANEEEDHLTSSLGLQVSDSIMREVTSPFPAPDGRGDARLVIGGSFGETRVLALDRAGRILGYGYGEGDVQELSICPGARVAIESVAGPGGQFLAIRRLSDLEVIREVHLPEGFVEEIECTRRDGEKSLVALQVYDGDISRVVYELAFNAWKPVLEDHRRVADLRKGAVLLAGKRRVFVHDLNAGSTERVASYPLNIGDVQWSPDGKYIAGGAFPNYGSGPYPLAFVVRPNGLISREFKHHSMSAPLRWAGNEKFLIDGVLLSHRLNDRGRIGGNYFVDGTGFRRWFYELYTGSLRRLDLRGEAPERSVGFVSHITFALEAIPGGAPVTAPPHS